MKRPWHIWIGFAVCVAVLLTALGWISSEAVRLDDARMAAARDAALEENVRLSLWRMDSYLAPLVAGESTRPYFVYDAFMPVDRAYARMFNPKMGSETLIPSPLLAGGSADVLLYFQYDPDGRITSPQVPTRENRALAHSTGVSSEAIELAEKRLQQFYILANDGYIVGYKSRRNPLTSMLPKPPSEPVQVVLAPVVQTPTQQYANTQRRNDRQQKLGQGAVEFDERNRAFNQLANNSIGNFQLNNGDWNGMPLPATDVTGTLMTPLWIDDQLVLARRVLVRGQEYVQGCLLNWPELETTLLKSIDDLLPNARLEPAKGNSQADHSRRLAALPAKLVPGKLPAVTTTGMSPIRFSLVVAWTCVLLAAAVVAVLLSGVVRLSERRASFVTAVTHELRTPLTTFQMYTEMLAEGMVSDEDQRQGYINTLRLEAARLTHMVENVLSYARLERGRSDGRMETVPLGDLVQRIETRLNDRATAAGMKLVVEEDGQADGVTVRTNVSAAEQVLFNLVDNACKYAATADDKRIHLSARSENGTAQLIVRDHGPGISTAESKRLFQAFSKSAHDAAHTAPGVGLGLALSRRLSRDMGGDLELEQNGDTGAAFVFTLAKEA